MEEFIAGVYTGGLIMPLLEGKELSGVALGFIMAGIILVCIVIPYLLGSLNFAIILSKKIYNEDVREHGSKNGGATNMLRTYGKKAAILTFGGDILKAIVSTLIGYALFGVDGASIAGLFCMMGHIFPVYYKFKGGKGVATLAATVLMIHPLTFLVLLLCFAVIVLATKYVSLGSVMCCLIYPLILSRLSDVGLPVAMAIVSAVLVIFMHRTNIKRLLEGNESKISLSKKNKKDKN